jgi:tetratricopeptide (TPR) repeat protein
MSVERGSALLKTGRFELAENEFRSALGQEPQNALAHAMLSLCLCRRKLYADATTEAEQAVHLRPDWAFAYTCLATVLFERERPIPALAAAQEAVRIDPGNPESHALVASIYVRQNKWKDALAAANLGLQADPAHTDCLNARGIALVHLGRRDEASQTIQGALQNNPESAETHANQGWALLHSGDHRAAMEHFREALRLKPELQWAKSGIIEAMKARNPIYRLMLRYFLFMARLDGRARLGIMVGLYVCYRVLLAVSQQNPGLRPIVLPFLIAYVIFALLTWLAYPLFNLLLRLDRFGRYALSDDQRHGANLLGLWLLATALLACVGWYQHNTLLLLCALVIGLSCLPASAIFRSVLGWPRWAMLGYTFLIVGIGLTSLLRPQVGDDDNLFLIFCYGILASSFVAGWLSNAAVKK